MPKISIVILTYNSSKYIEELLQGLLKKYSQELKDDELEIVVADNLSHDDTLVKVNKFKEKVRLIENKGNVGFAKGNNLAAKKARGDFLIFINPDARIKSGDIFKLASIFDDEKVGIVGGEIISFQGEKELSCGRFYNPFNTLVLALGIEEKIGLRFSPKQDRNVDFVSGGFLMIRKNLFDRLNGFDENYFMYLEDADLCFQARKKGFKARYSKMATIQHVGQGSSNRTFAVINIYKGLMYFNKKNYGKIAHAFVRLVLRAKAAFLVLTGKMVNNKYLVETYTEALKV